MKNFGLEDWVVVSPNPQLLEAPGLNRLAVKAGDLLESVRRVDTLAEAVADCTWVVGTTMRQIDGRRRSTPRELAEQASARHDECWGLVFGDERHGLTNEDLQQCHALSFIPAHEEQPSLNLAQAVVVYGYELAMARRGAVVPPEPVRANDAQLKEMKSAVTQGLQDCGFLRADHDQLVVDELLAPLVRTPLSRKEAGLWTAAWRVASKRLTKIQS